jgi:tetratricopeptide (TPR) repeat protein
MYSSADRRPQDWRALFERASAFHSQGRLAEALDGYRAVLTQCPELAEAFFNMGLIFLERKMDHPEAIAAFQKAIVLKPQWAEAHCNLARAYELAEIPEAAEAAYEQALCIKPDCYEACYNLGCLHLKAKQYDAAATHFSRATRMKSFCPEAYNNLGQAHEGLNDFASAEQCYARAHAMAPGMIAACFNLAQRFKADGRLDEAAALYEEALTHHPASSAAINNLGNIYRDQERLAEAIACYRQVVAMEPHLAEGHYNLGSALRLNEACEEALVCLHRAVQLKPDYADAWNNLALTCKNIGELDRALICFNRALALNPELAVAHWNRSFVHLLKEDFSSGWADFEWRFRMPQRKTIYPFELKGERWSGQVAPDATILVHDEQGLGDTLQFVRYLPQVKARCRKVVLETRTELISLLRGCAGVDDIIVRSTSGIAVADYDFYIPLMSLPGLFQTAGGNIPLDVPYVESDRNKTAQWRTQLSASQVKVGLVWSGRPQHTNDKNRSCKLEDLLPLLQLPGIHYLGLQKGSGSEQAALLPPGIAFTNLGDKLHDFSDTAALVANLDLLISVDTAVVHLAGAMGKPAWVMIPFIPDWRWGMHRQNCLWYPTLRLFRQERPRDWSGVVERMRRELFVSLKSNLADSVTD